MIRRLWRSDDSGASLILALVFVTVVAVVVTVVLSFADTSLRTTLRLRDQAAGAANADGAAQIAINDLRKGNYVGFGNCFTGGPTLQLSNVYQPQAGPADSAAVTCGQDLANSTGQYGPPINYNNRPGNAILTLGTSNAEDGLYVKVSGGRTLKVRGSVYSNSNIYVDLGTLETQFAGVKAAKACVGSITSTPAPVCNTNTLTADPNYPPPTAAATPRTVPACRGDGNVVTFQPGLYDAGDINDLNALTRSNGCRDAIFHFTPGTYYFDFPANREWTINTGYLVGGTAAPGAPLTDGVAPTIPGACWAPIPPRAAPPGTWTPPPPNAGVQFVFGGGSHVEVRDARFEVCGTYSISSPPIAVYGLKTTANGVPAQSGCTTQVNGCATILSDNSPNNKLYVQGTTYVPGGLLDISLNNNTGQVFRFGVISRSLKVNPTGSAELGDPVIEVPDDTPGGAMRTVLYLNVYVCPGQSSCTPSGRLRLRLKVEINDPTGVVVAGSREVRVLSWSVLR